MVTHCMTLNSYTNRCFQIIEPKAWNYEGLQYSSKVLGSHSHYSFATLRITNTTSSLESFLVHETLKIAMQKKFFSLSLVLLPKTALFGGEGEEGVESYVQNERGGVPWLLATIVS